MLAVSFHKVAEAQEALKDWGKAVFAHTQAREVVQRSLGPAHPLAQSLAKCRPQVPARPHSRSRHSEFLETYAANIGRSTGCPMLARQGAEGFANYSSRSTREAVHEDDRSTGL